MSGSQGKRYVELTGHFEKEMKSHSWTTQIFSFVELQETPSTVKTLCDKVQDTLYPESTGGFWYGLHRSFTTLQDDMPVDT
jgi:hypothetical protein